MLGFKGLAWRSVEQPPILPKPKLVPLTGGYRRIPILQDGADLWCDTRPDRPRARAARALADLLPATARAAHGEAIAWWAEQQFMRPSALFVSGINADHMPRGPARGPRQAARPAAALDRGGARGGDPQPPSGAAADQVAGRDAGRRPALPAGRAALHRRFRRPITSSGSIAAATSTAAPSSIPIPKLLAWRDRMAAIGHGTRTEIEPGRGARRRPRTRRRPPPRPSDPQDGDPGPASAPACGRRTMRATGPRARCCSSTPTRSRCCAAIPRSARSPCISRGWATTGGAAIKVSSADAGPPLRAGAHGRCSHCEGASCTPPTDGASSA